MHGAAEDGVVVGAAEAVLDGGGAAAVGDLAGDGAATVGDSAGILSGPGPPTGTTHGSMATRTIRNISTRTHSSRDLREKSNRQARVKRLLPLIHANSLNDQVVDQPRRSHVGRNNHQRAGHSTLNWIESLRVHDLEVIETYRGIA